MLPLRERVVVLERRSSAPGSYFNAVTKAKVAALRGLYSESLSWLVKAAVALEVRTESRDRDEIGADETTGFDAITTKSASARGDAARKAEDARVLAKIREEDEKKKARKAEANKKKRDKKKAAAVRRAEAEDAEDSADEPDDAAATQDSEVDASRAHGAAVAAAAATAPAPSPHASAAPRAQWPLNGTLGCALFASAYAAAAHAAGDIPMSSSGHTGGAAHAHASIIRTWLRVAGAAVAQANIGTRPPPLPPIVSDHKADDADLSRPPKDPHAGGPFAVITCLPEDTNDEIPHATQAGGVFRPRAVSARKYVPVTRHDLLWLAGTSPSSVVVTTIPGESLVLVVPAAPVTSTGATAWPAAPVAVWRCLLSRFVRGLVLDPTHDGGALDAPSLDHTSFDVAEHSHDESGSDSVGSDAEGVVLDDEDDDDNHNDDGDDDDHSGGGPTPQVRSGAGSDVGSDSNGRDAPLAGPTRPLESAPARAAVSSVSAETAALSDLLVRQYMALQQAAAGAEAAEAAALGLADSERVDRGRMVGSHQRTANPVARVLGVGTFDPQAFSATLGGTWIVMLCSGGRFAGAVWRGGVCITHVAFQQYIVRKKQGGRQSAADAAGGHKSSAGANLRRACEVKFRDRITSTFAQWDSLPLEPAPKKQKAKPAPRGDDDEDDVPAAVGPTFSAWDTATVMAVFAPGPHNMRDLTGVSRKPDQLRGRRAQYFVPSDDAVVRVPFPIGRPTWGAAKATFDLLQSTIVPYAAGH